MLSASDSEYYVKIYKDLNSIKNLTSQQTNLLGNKKNHDSLTGLFVVHTTSFFPENRIIYPRLDYKINISNEIGEVIKKLFSILRSTVHFSLNSTVSKHKVYLGSTSKRFIVIDELAKASKSISGGYAEDLFCIGPYKLSKNATILIPESQKNEIYINEQIKKFNKKINIFYYKGDEDKALANWLKEKKASVLSPLQNDENIPNLICKLGENHFISSENLMKKLNKTFCSHDVSPNMQIESYIADGEKNLFSNFLTLATIAKNGVMETKNNINLYIQSIKNTYKLNEDQTKFINLCNKTVLLVVDILGKKNIDKIQEEFKTNETLITKYDQHIFDDLAELKKTIKKFNEKFHLAFFVEEKANGEFCVNRKETPEKIENWGKLSIIEKL